MSLLEVNHLSKTFEDNVTLFGTTYFTAVDDISFTLSPRKTLAIIGKNGSGKSTLAQMIAGAIEPTSGEIRFQQKALEYGDYTYRAKHIRMVFQDQENSFNPTLNVGQILDAPLQLVMHLSEEERNQKIFETLTLVGLYPDHANLKINTLSTSQKQRVSLARALILQPEIIIIDDSLGSLDSSVKIQLMNLSLELQERLGIAYIYISQQLGFIKHVADHVLVMDNGKLVEYGTPYQLFTQPQSEVTKKLVESYFGRLLDDSAWIKTNNLDI